MRPWLFSSMCTTDRPGGAGRDAASSAERMTTERGGIPRLGESGLGAQDQEE